MLMEVYTTKELDKIDVWMEKIADGNKKMETLHVKIHKLKDQAQEKILDIFEDDAREKLIAVEVVVEYL